MSPEKLFQNIQKKKSLLCVGLDTDPAKIPAHLHQYEDPVFEFNKRIIEATADLAVAYKPNIAFYESMGVKGWETLKKTLEIIPEDVFTIADAKRGDIGNTSRMYAKAFFEDMNFDSITVAPYMGKDSVTPFLEYEGKWVFLLALTSNAGAEDFQWHREGEQTLYGKVVRTAESWGKEQPGHLGYVTGATRPEYLGEIRAMAPKAFFLVPGIGAQGGDLQGVCQHGLNELGGLLINSSRGILYASNGEDFAEAARERALALQQATNEFLRLPEA